MDPVKDCKVLFFTENEGLCDGPKGGNFWKTLLEEKGSEKVQEGGSQCVLTPDDINIQDQRSSHAGSQQKKCSKYFKKENHNHNPPQSAHSPIPKSKIIFFLLNFQNIPNLLLFLRTLELCNAPRSILINQRRSKQNISREKETDCFFSSSSS